MPSVGTAFGGNADEADLAALLTNDRFPNAATAA